MRVRLKDIAEDLNLSKMTISKVLRGQTDISDETKARVLKRVKELKYIPNISASSLSNKNHRPGSAVHRRLLSLANRRRRQSGSQRRKLWSYRRVIAAGRGL
jgi:transcriptional regulator with XRE-family HTH domain